ncbi:hypothetical protein PI126_g11016 [Phytophthora idaei]|nr:hypothetical protein PI126_g11016 [Phytophthora idaei]
MMHEADLLKHVITDMNGGIAFRHGRGGGEDLDDIDRENLSGSDEGEVDKDAAPEAVIEKLPPPESKPKSVQNVTRETRSVLLETQRSNAASIEAGSVGEPLALKRTSPAQEKFRLVQDYPGLLHDVKDMETLDIETGAGSRFGGLSCSRSKGAAALSLLAGNVA